MNSGVKKRVLYYSQIAIRGFSVAQGLLLFLWSFSSIVEGVGNTLYAESGTNAICHLGFWLSIEILILMFGLLTTVLDTSKKALRNTLIVYMVMLVIGMGANLLHIGLTVPELTRCTSVLCVTNNGILWGLMALFFCLFCLEVLSMFYAYWFYRYLQIEIKKN